MIRFNDGESFDTSGPLRIVHRRDGFYVAGQGMLLPVRDAAEAREVIAEHNGRACHGGSTPDRQEPTAR